MYEHKIANFTAVNASFIYDRSVLVMESSSLSLLAVYSDSESEEEISGSRVSVKRCNVDDDNVANKIFKNENRLPVPTAFLPPSHNEKNSTDHGGRIRSFPHERGNWSTYVYISIDIYDGLEKLIEKIVDKCKSSIILQTCSDFHISLTKTLILRHHWIELFTKSISNCAKNISRFDLLFENLKVYCNEERTRTFVGLKVQIGHSNLVNLVEMLDSCVKEFNLPTFYENPSFHMSLVWCVGDYANLLNDIISDLNSNLESFMALNVLRYKSVDSIKCKTGNKYFNFTLS